MTTGKSLEHCSEFLIFILSEHWSTKKYEIQRNLNPNLKFESTRFDQI